MRGEAARVEAVRGETAKGENARGENVRGEAERKISSLMDSLEGLVERRDYNNLNHRPTDRLEKHVEKEGQ